jgi:lysine/ornithine N-monooxygenase
LGFLRKHYGELQSFFFWSLSRHFYDDYSSWIFLQLSLKRYHKWIILLSTMDSLHRNSRNAKMVLKCTSQLGEFMAKENLMLLFLLLMLTINFN